MIGVIAESAQLEAASEFFELFKSPWEPAVEGRKYAVVLSTVGEVRRLDTGLLLIYSSHDQPHDGLGVAVAGMSGPVTAAWAGSTLPIYGDVALFDQDAGPDRLRVNGRPLDYCYRSGSGVVRRIGYDLFREIHYLLTTGQPAQHASIPTLELHVALLRSFLLEAGIPFVEVPPRPAGYDFVCCLTHDVDFFGIRRHKFDRTLAGFVARASLGTLRDLARGRRRPADAARNVSALLSLPFVFAGVAPDLWRPFDDYARTEDARRSTFFLIPFKRRPGVAPDGTVDPVRGVAYQMNDISDEMVRAAGRGSELAVHGIDAWRSADAGRTEMRQLTSVTGQQAAGVRMHWLYFDQQSPRQLEAAGFDYDSTWGYNETIGYRAGTSQVFRWPACRKLLELPMSIMDSALFFPDRMGLTDSEASTRCRTILANATRFGGTVVINWHCRSLAPERLWDHFYQGLLQDVETGGRAWFATGTRTVDWFRSRRAIRFSTDGVGPQVRIGRCPSGPIVPPALIQIHRPATSSKHDVLEVRFDGRDDVTLPL